MRLQVYGSEGVMLTLGKSNKHALQALPNKQLTINTMRL